MLEHVEHIWPMSIEDLPTFGPAPEAGPLPFVEPILITGNAGGLHGEKKNIILEQPTTMRGLTIIVINGCIYIYI